LRSETSNAMRAERAEHAELAKPLGFVHGHGFALT
jgi:hypothetical protein